LGFRAIVACVEPGEEFYATDFRLAALQISGVLRYVSQTLGDRSRTPA